MQTTPPSLVKNASPNGLLHLCTISLVIVEGKVIRCLLQMVQIVMALRRSQILISHTCSHYTQLDTDILSDTWQGYLNIKKDNEKTICYNKIGICSLYKNRGLCDHLKGKSLFTLKAYSLTWVVTKVGIGKHVRSMLVIGLFMGAEDYNMESWDLIIIFQNSKNSKYYRVP